MLITAIPSGLACIGVLFVFPNSRHLKKFKYNYIIAYIAFSDFCTSVGMAIGLQKDNTFGCWAQVLLTNACPLWSIFWTNVIAFKVLQFQRYQSTQPEVMEISVYVHAVVWVLPIVLTFLILTTNTWGCAPEEGGECWCFIGERSDTPEWASTFWGMVSIYRVIII